MMIKSGTIMISVGSISVPSTTTNMRFRPLNRNFANAYPASAERNTVLTVVTVATKMLFKSARMKGADSESARRLTRNSSPGRRRGGDLKISDSVSAAPAGGGEKGGRRRLAGSSAPGGRRGGDLKISDCVSVAAVRVQ